jgi:hypothetical protein
MRALALAAALLSLAARAETGWSPQGLPLISYNSDEGLGYGALPVDSSCSPVIASH